MIVAVESGLYEIERYLEREGHKIIPLGTSNLVPEAVVYQTSGIPSFNLISGALDERILLVYAKGMSPEEVAMVLERKCYGALFPDSQIM